MSRTVMIFLVLCAAALVLFMTSRRQAATAVAAAAATAAAIPDPVTDEKLAAKPGQETIVLAGGCFWGVQTVFKHVKGVTRSTAGYSGGALKNPDYETVSSGSTGHAESVEIVYDPSVITLGQLLKVFFSVVHDPTQLNRQGPDTGTQYRSAIFFSSPEQERIAEAYIAQLEAAKSFPRPIVTQVVPLRDFYAAEMYHQNYAMLHPDDAYIVRNDAPKVEDLHEQFPGLYKK